MSSVTKDNLISVLSAIGELSNEGIMLLNVGAGRIEYVNNALANMFDITHETFRTQPAFFINHILPEDIGYLKTEHEKLMANQSVEDAEFRLRHHDGRLRMLNCNAYLLESGKYIVALFKDITDSREHENYIINYGAKKNTLLEMVTHNLSGPLTVSKNMIESLETKVKGHDVLAEDVRDINVHIQLIKENTRHCIELVNDFLQEEHMVSEHIHTKKNRFDVVSKLHTIVERFQKGYPDFDFLMMKNDESIYINNDDVKFLQVMNNLISNAVKWSPTKSVIEIRIEAREGHVNLTVRDHGVGIPDEIKGFIFQRNTAASRKGLRGEVSMGMGLYIVKKLVMLMEGTISFESDKNGTTFTVSLPRE